jgi:hypothetical protein
VPTSKSVPRKLYPTSVLLRRCGHLQAVHAIQKYVDPEDQSQIVNADLPRGHDPQGHERICPLEQPYNKYPPFSRERIILGTVLALPFLVLILANLINQWLF